MHSQFSRHHYALANFQNSVWFVFLLYFLFFILLTAYCVFYIVCFYCILGLLLIFYMYLCRIFLPHWNKRLSSQRALGQYRTLPKAESTFPACYCYCRCYVCCRRGFCPRQCPRDCIPSVWFHSPLCRRLLYSRSLPTQASAISCFNDWSSQVCHSILFADIQVNY